MYAYSAPPKGKMNCRFSVVVSLAEGRSDTCQFCGLKAEAVLQDKTLDAGCRAEAQRRMAQYSDRQDRTGQHRPITRRG